MNDSILSIQHRNSGSSLTNLGASTATCNAAKIKERKRDNSWTVLACGCIFLVSCAFAALHVAALGLQFVKVRTEFRSSIDFESYEFSQLHSKHYLFYSLANEISLSSRISFPSFNCSLAHVFFSSYLFTRNLFLIYVPHITAYAASDVLAL